MSRLECKCDEKCHVSLWIEDGHYLWASWTDKDGDEDSRQVFRFDKIEQMIQLRDMLNEAIKDEVGL